MGKEDLNTDRIKPFSFKQIGIWDNSYWRWSSLWLHTCYEIQQAKVGIRERHSPVTYQYWCGSWEDEDKVHISAKEILFPTLNDIQWRGEPKYNITLNFIAPHHYTHSSLSETDQMHYLIQHSSLFETDQMHYLIQNNNLVQLGEINSILDKRRKEKLRKAKQD